MSTCLIFVVLDTISVIIATFFQVSHEGNNCKRQLSSRLSKILIVFIAYSDDLCFFLPGSASPASKSKGFQGPNPFVLACVLPELPEPGGGGKLGVIQ